MAAIVDVAVDWKTDFQGYTKVTTYLENDRKITKTEAENTMRLFVIALAGYF